MNTLLRKNMIVILTAFAASFALADSGNINNASSNRAQAKVGSIESKFSNIDMSVDSNAIFSSEKNGQIEFNQSVGFLQRHIN